MRKKKPRIYVFKAGFEKFAKEIMAYRSPQVATNAVLKLNCEDCQLRKMIKEILEAKKGTT